MVFDITAIVRFTLIVIGIGLVALKLSGCLDELSTLAVRGAQEAIRLAFRERSYSGTELIMGAFAIIVILILAITDRSIIGYSFYVVFPVDKEFQALAGLAITAGEVFVGHLLVECVSKHSFFLDRENSARKRATLFAVFLGAFLLLLGTLYVLAFQRVAQTAHDVVQDSGALTSTDGPVGLSATTLMMAHTAGLLALAMGLITGVVGVAMTRALRCVICVIDLALRLPLGLLGITLQLLSVALNGVSNLLLLPRDVADGLLKFGQKMVSPFRPLGVRFRAGFTEPAALKTLNYAQVLALLAIVRRLESDEIDEETRQQLNREYLLLISAVRARANTAE